MPDRYPDALTGPVRLLARAMAIVGGIVLTLLVILTCVSVLGRGLNTLGHSDWFETALPDLATWLIETGVGPVLGDFELVEAGIAFAIFAFLPYCQLRSGHAAVGVFTDMAPPWIGRWIVAFWEVVLTVIILLIAWRLYDGFLDKLRNGQTTFLLQFPVWWSYGASLVAAVVASLVAIWCAWARLVEAITWREVMPAPGEADH